MTFQTKRATKMMPNNHEQTASGYVQRLLRERNSPTEGKAARTGVITIITSAVIPATRCEIGHRTDAANISAGVKTAWFLKYSEDFILFFFLVLLIYDCGSAAGNTS